MDRVFCGDKEVVDRNDALQVFDPNGVSPFSPAPLFNGRKFNGVSLGFFAHPEISGGMGPIPYIYTSIYRGPSCGIQILKFFFAGNLRR